VTPLTQRVSHDGQQLRFPYPDGFVADGIPPQQEDLAKISQCQPVAQAAEHHEGDDVAGQPSPVQHPAAAFVELLGAVSTAVESWLSRNSRAAGLVL
jgi:hypothetical protein